MDCSHQDTSRTPTSAPTKRYLAVQMLKPTSYSGAPTPGQRFKERQEKALDETLK